MIYWFTGQPGAGKTTLARLLKEELRKRGYPAFHLDGDELRGIMENRDYSEVGRRLNITAAQALAAKVHSAGVYVIVSFITPYRELREAFKRKEEVLEVYVHTSDIRGREAYFVSNYEPPLEKYLDIDTTGVTPERCVERILNSARS